MGAQDKRHGFAADAFAHLDELSRQRALTQDESDRLYRAFRQMEHNENRRIRAQAGSPPPRRNGR